MKCKTLNNQLFKTNLPWLSENRVTFSSIENFELENYDPPTYSIKYVVQGTEHYLIDGRRYPLSAGHFLITNKHQPLDIVINARKKVTGFCIHIKDSLVNNALESLLKTDDALLKNPFDKNSIAEFKTLIYSTKENELGQCLEKMYQNFDHGEKKIDVDENEFYYMLTQHLINLNSSSVHEKSINVLKNSTKNELVKRLNIAKQIIETQHSETLNIDIVAKESMLSSSHLYRSFKKIYGLSPYQYFLKVRMQKAAKMITSKEANITEVAYQFGFPDLPSFSKAFKKNFGVAPKQFSN